MEFLQRFAGGSAVNWSASPEGQGKLRQSSAPARVARLEQELLAASVVLLEARELRDRLARDLSAAEKAISQANRDVAELGAYLEAARRDLSPGIA